MSVNSEYRELLNKCKRKGIKVKLVSSKVLGDYAGMNDEAAKKLGFKKLKDDTILLDKNLSLSTKLRTLKHEACEMTLMEKKKLSYWKAHRIALGRERAR